MTHNTIQYALRNSQYDCVGRKATIEYQDLLWKMYLSLSQGANHDHDVNDAHDLSEVEESTHMNVPLFVKFETAINMYHHEVGSTSTETHESSSVTTLLDMSSSSSLNNKNAVNDDGNNAETSIASEMTLERDDEEDHDEEDEDDIWTLPLLLVQPTTGRFEILELTIPSVENATVGHVLDLISEASQQKSLSEQSYRGIGNAQGIVKTRDSLVQDWIEDKSQVVLAIPENASTAHCFHLARGILNQRQMIDFVSVLQQGCISSFHCG